MNNTGSLSGITTQVTYSVPSQEELENMANMREVFFTRDVLNTINILKADLQKYVDNGDISRMKAVVLDELIPSFLKKICNVYDTAPIFKFKDSVEQGSIDEFDTLRKEVMLNRIMPETLERSRFHNTIISFIRYYKPLDKLYIENSWHAGSCRVETYEGYDSEMKKFSYIQHFGDEQYRIYWELLETEGDEVKTLHYKVKLDKQGKEPETVNDDMRMPIGENKDLEGPPYWPFVVYRYSERGKGFWGNAMDSLVELVRAINILLTVTNDDTIQETIRILLLNFTPSGTEGEKGQLKTGLRHPLKPDGQLGENNMDAKILSAELYNDEVMKLIEGLWSVVANTHNVGNVLKPDFKQASSGLALRLQNEPLLRDWEHDINIVTPLDIELVNKLVEVNNYHRKDKQVKPEILKGMFLEYQEPNLVTDEKEEYEIEKQKWADGVSSPLLYVMRKNPEMTEDDAKVYIEKNLQDLEDLTGGKITIPGKDDNINNDPPEDDIS